MPVSGTGKTLTWWVGEQFQPDGSALFAIMSDSKPGGHPTPGDNQAIFGPWPSQAKAESERDSGKFRVDAKHAYYGKNVVKGPGGLSVPKNQAPPQPHIPNPLSGVDALVSILSQASTWVRVAEVAIGIILIAVGVAKLTNAVPVATKIASVVK